MGDALEVLRFAMRLHREVVIADGILVQIDAEVPVAHAIVGAGLRGAGTGREQHPAENSRASRAWRHGHARIVAPPRLKLQAYCQLQLTLGGEPRLADFKALAVRTVD